MRGLQVCSVSLRAPSKPDRHLGLAPFLSTVRERCAMPLSGQAVTALTIAIVLPGFYQKLSRQPSVDIGPTREDVLMRFKSFLG